MPYGMGVEGACKMDLRLEIVVLPVADLDRAKAFWITRLPVGCRCSRRRRLPGGAADASRLTGVDHLRQRRHREHTRFYAGHLSRGGRHRPAKTSRLAAGTAHRLPGPDRNRTSYASFASFSDPDGNGWVLQEITERLPGR